jgi:hypothetical protein
MAFGPFDRGSMPSAIDRLTSAHMLYGAFLMAATLLVHGAFLTSLGLALATWIPRPSRAMAISVTAYVLIAVAWPFLCFSLGSVANRGAPLPALSPIFVAGCLADVLSIRSMQFGGFLWAATIWDVLVLVAAILLLESTVHSFDRCLGRIPEQPGWWSRPWARIATQPMP